MNSGVKGLIPTKRVLRTGHDRLLGPGDGVGGGKGSRGGTPLYLLYGDVPLDSVLKRICNSRVCVLNRVFIPWTSGRVLLSRVACARAHQNIKHASEHGIIRKSDLNLKVSVLTKPQLQISAIDPMHQSVGNRESKKTALQNALAQFLASSPPGSSARIIRSKYCQPLQQSHKDV